VDSTIYIHRNEANNDDEEEMNGMHTTLSL